MITQIVTKLNISNGDKTPKLKLWQNYKTQIVTKCELLLLVRTLWHLDNQWDVLCAAIYDSRNVLLKILCLRKYNSIDLLAISVYERRAYCPCRLCTWQFCTLASFCPCSWSRPTSPSCPFAFSTLARARGGRTSWGGTWTSLRRNPLGTSDIAAANR